MASKRKFYKTIIQVEVLSEEPYEFNGLMPLYGDITEGHCSGVSDVKKMVVLSGKQTAKALMKQGSDPEFFLLDENGNDIDD